MNRGLHFVNFNLYVLSLSPATASSSTMSSQSAALEDKGIQTRGVDFRASQKKRSGGCREDRVIEGRFDSQPENHAKRKRQREQSAEKCRDPGTEAQDQGNPNAISQSVTLGPIAGI
jgi:hypothetical protein